jgi:hypothetical protein
VLHGFEAVGIALVDVDELDLGHMAGLLLLISSERCESTLGNGR